LPPCSIENKSENKYRLTMPIAGFSLDERVENVVQYVPSGGRFGMVCSNTFGPVDTRKHNRSLTRITFRILN
jgi:hypothetical protein